MTIKATYDVIKWSPKVRVVKYSPDVVQDIVRMIGHEPDGGDLRYLEEHHGLLSSADFAYAEGNLLVTVGLNNITANMIGSGVTMTNAHTIVGVGTSTSTALIGDVHLGADASTAYYQQADSTYPSQSNGVLSCNCTYTSSNANFAWQEWCFAVATGTLTAGATLSAVGTTPVMINHKVQSLGTKAGGSTWTLQATVTLS